MAKTENAGRPYRSVLRAEQAEQTRLRIAHSARRCFIERGWAGTSIRAVAASAGVSEATVFAVYGNKAGLAGSLLDTAEADADTARLEVELATAVGDASAQLAALVQFERRLFEHAGDALRVIVEGQRNEPALRAAYGEGRSRGEQARLAIFTSWPSSTMRPGMTVGRALDLFAITVSIQSYDIATRERGWTPQATESWWLDILTAFILA